MALPLDGLVAYEFGSNVAGPFAGSILAELGATLIKIERPEGDDARSWGPPFAPDGTATIFHALNRNKKSVTVDLKDPAQLQKLRERIAADGDIVVQNMRPGAMKRLGLDSETLLEMNPRLIYCNLNAFGADGPLKDRPGYDALMQAFGGIMSVTGEEGQAPVRCGISVIDMGTGMWCAIGILSALFRRGVSGKGGLVDAALFETAVQWMTFYSADYQTTGNPPKRHGSGVRGIAPYEAFECADGYLIVAASNDRLFIKLADAIGQPEWKADPRFATNPKRDANRVELKRQLSNMLIQQPRAHWQSILDEAGVPNAPTQSIDEVLEHPQTVAAGMVQQVAGAPFGLIGLPLSFDRERPGPALEGAGSGPGQ
ncbi:MAG: CaiB/BaiF CoA transferase family protein [Minwuia sp.]|uniref:CaiB/BaiF CoA transferase family protein n=1 Tax=Minwuia sp. TaxID=2493630 RepID=UPI003A84B0B4